MVKRQTQVKRWIKRLSAVTRSAGKQTQSLKRDGNEGGATRLRKRTSPRWRPLKQRPTAEKLHPGGVSHCTQKHTAGTKAAEEFCKLRKLEKRSVVTERQARETVWICKKRTMP